MKKAYVLTGFVLFLMFLFFINPLAYGQIIREEQQGISVDGSAKIWIEPNRARVFLGIETMANDVETARNDNAANIKKVMDALKALNIKGMLVKAPSYNVSLVKEPEYDATRSGRLPKIIGYKVKQDFTVLVSNDDVLKLSKDSARVIDTALDNGVNIITEVIFFKEDDSSDKRDALTLAVKDAISNAKVIAAAAGVSIKDITLINSSIGYWSAPISRNSLQMTQAAGFEDASGIPTAIVAGKISVNANARLQCSIKQNSD